MMSSSLYLGLMSGTSLDGVDAVLADFASARPTVLACVSLPYPDSLRNAVLAPGYRSPDQQRLEAESD